MLEVARLLACAARRAPARHPLGLLVGPLARALRRLGLVRGPRLARAAPALRRCTSTWTRPARAAPPTTPCSTPPRTRSASRRAWWPTSPARRAAARRFSRAGDQSFWGVGVPVGLHVALGAAQAGHRARRARWSGCSAARASPGGGTRRRTRSTRSTPTSWRSTRRSIVASALRWLNAPVLPLDHARAGAALVGELEALQAAAGARFDLAPAAGRGARRSAERLERVRRRGWRASSRRAGGATRGGQPALMRLSRVLVPLAYTERRPLHPRPGACRSRRWPGCSARGSCPASIPTADAYQVRAGRARPRAQPCGARPRLGGLGGRRARSAPDEGDSSMTQTRGTTLLAPHCRRGRLGLAGASPARPTPRSAAARSPSCGPPIPVSLDPQPRDHRARRVGVLQHARAAADARREDADPAVAGHLATR